MLGFLCYVFSILSLLQQYTSKYYEPITTLKHGNRMKQKINKKSQPIGG